ncbi:MAG: guanine permease, partial [Clostridia bacterium]|nr:guanine permease [Clostridia bacterium]
LKENGTKVSTEIIAGFTTFFAMAYIIFVNPEMLSKTGIPFGAVFLATIIASAVGTLFMGLFANVPYALAPGMGLNAVFTFTVCFLLGFTWKQALAMVFLCGIINILITVTRIRKEIIKSIPEDLQNAIGGGIGIFIAYIGVKNANLLQFISDNKSLVSVNDQPFDAAGSYTGIYTATTNGGIVPELVKLNDSGVLLAIIGLVIIVVLLVLKIKGAILIGILATTLLGIPMGVVNISTFTTSDIGNSFSQLGETFGAALGSEGLLSLFSDPAKIPLVLITIFAFSLSDTFDTIGTFIGTGRATGIFSAEDQKALETGKGFKSKMDKALFADSIATSIGAILGTSNTTTYVESAAGISVGGRTGLTSVVTALLFLASILLAPIAGIVPAAATAPALIVVGIMMLGAFKNIRWDDIEVTIPVFFAAVFMAFCYNISYGIAAAFIFYCIVKICRGKFKEIHPILLISALLFIINFIVLAII